MLEWRLLVAWRVDGWHIDILFSGSVQSAASKHGQTVKRSLATVPSRVSPEGRGPTECENSEISQTPARCISDLQHQRTSAGAVIPAWAVGALA